MENVKANILLLFITTLFCPALVAVKCSDKQTDCTSYKSKAQHVMLFNSLCSMAGIDILLKCVQSIFILSDYHAFCMKAPFIHHDRDNDVVSYKLFWHAAVAAHWHLVLFFYFFFLLQVVVSVFIIKILQFGANISTRHQVVSSKVAGLVSLPFFLVLVTQQKKKQKCIHKLKLRKVKTGRNVA